MLLASVSKTNGREGSGCEKEGLCERSLQGAEGLLTLRRPGEVAVLLEEVVQGGSCGGEASHESLVV